MSAFDILIICAIDSSFAVSGTSSETEEFDSLDECPMSKEQVGINHVYPRSVKTVLTTQPKDENWVA